MRYHIVALSVVLLFADAPASTTVNSKPKASMTINSFQDWTESRTENYAGVYVLAAGSAESQNWSTCTWKIKLNRGYWEAHYSLQHPVPGSGDTVAVSPDSVKIKGANIELSQPGFKTMPVFLQKTFSGRFVVSKDGKKKGILFGDDFFARKSD